MKNNIFVLWWQGIENAPEVVKICNNSLKKAVDTGNSKICFLDKNNYKEYIDIPKYILDKFAQGKISLTHLSDYIRFKILYKYGGIWVDATMLFSKKIDEDLFKKDFFTLKNPNACTEDITSKWECFFIGGKKEYPFFKLLIDFWEEYWKKEEDIIAYLLTEHIFYIAYEENKKMKKIFDECDSFYYPIDYFQKIMNNEYEKERFIDIISNEKYIKLSYKKKLYENVNGYITFYGKLKEIYG